MQARGACVLEELKAEICELNLELPRGGLVTWTSGNVSGRDRETGLVVIKPSGIRFEALRPEHMVVVDDHGQTVEGDLKASSDVFTHCVIYRGRPDVYGVVHTHSRYATAFAAVGKTIPPVLTAICDEFGGTIPLGKLELIGNEDIGREVLRSIGDSPAILMQNHGVFTIGKTPEAAVKAAVMVEDVAHTVFVAMQLGEPIVIPDDIVARLRQRYVTQYGQG
jgi:L-ribulose-5-phosphate 4-epimerase